MGTIFSMDFMYGITKFIDMIILNMVYVITCIPIFTIGAANVAMYEVTLKLEKNTESYVLISYLKAFKNNFKIGTKVWGIIALFIAVAFADLMYAGMYPGVFSYILYILVFAITTVLTLVCTFIFPVIAKFDNQWKVHMKNALLMSVAHLPYTLALILVNTSAFVIMLVIPRTMVVGIPVYIFFGFSGTAYLSSMLYNRIFEKYE